MPKRRPRLPIDAFPSRYLLALRAGSSREIKLKLPSPGDAIKLRQDINVLRAGMKENNHPDADLYMRTELIIAKEDPSTLIFRPRGSKFEAAFDAAGIPAPDQNTNTETSSPAPEEPGPLTELDEFLKGWEDKNT